MRMLQSSPVLIHFSVPRGADGLCATLTSFLRIFVPGWKLQQLTGCGLENLVPFAASVSRRNHQMHTWFKTCRIAVPPFTVSFVISLAAVISYSAHIERTLPIGFRESRNLGA